MKVLDSIGGLLRVELTSPDFGKLFCMLNDCGIILYDIHYINSVTLTCTVYRRSYKALYMLVNKEGVKVKIISRIGIFWRAKSLNKRPVLLAGLLVIFLMTLYLPTKVLFIAVEGNEKIPGNLILESAQRCGVYVGASRNSLRSEVFKNEMLEELTQLRWAGVNTYGCTAVISVKEREERRANSSDGPTCNIVAAKDAVVNHITILKGESKCVLGQSVQRGDLLVSGYTECGHAVKVTGADAEIYGDTIYSVSAIYPDITDVRDNILETRTRYSLIIGNNLIKLSQGSGILGSTCAKMYKTYYISLPGRIQLPIGLLVEWVEVYGYSQNGPAESADMKQLADYVESYLKSQMISGCIIDSDCIVENDVGALNLYGKYFCSELIGQIQREEIKTYNEQDYRKNCKC